MAPVQEALREWRLLAPCPRLLGAPVGNEPKYLGERLSSGHAFAKPAQKMPQLPGHSASCQADSVMAPPRGIATLFIRLLSALPAR